MRFRHVCRMFLVHWRSLTCPGPVFTMPVTSLSASRHWNSTNVRRLQSLLLRLVGPRNMVMAARCKYTQQTVHCWSPRLFFVICPSTWNDLLLPLRQKPSLDSTSKHLFSQNSSHVFRYLLLSLSVSAESDCCRFKLCACTR